MFISTYHIVKIAKNADDLKIKLNGLYVDPVKEEQGFAVSLGAQLAMEGELERVEWLRMLGADVHQIAFGFAVVGHHTQVEHYRQEFRARVNDIVFGYALARNEKKVQEYLKKYCASMYKIAQGYELADYCLPLLDAVMQKKEKQRNSHSIAYGYILAKNHLELELHRQNNKIGVNDIATYYAMAGQFDKVREYQSKFAANINQVALNFAIAGDDSKVAQCQTLGATLKQVPWYYTSDSPEVVNYSEALYAFMFHLANIHAPQYQSIVIGGIHLVNHITHMVGYNPSAVKPQTLNLISNVLVHGVLVLEDLHDAAKTKINVLKFMHEVAKCPIQYSGRDKMMLGGCIVTSLAFLALGFLSTGHHLINSMLNRIGLSKAMGVALTMTPPAMAACFSGYSFFVSRTNKALTTQVEPFKESIHMISSNKN